MKRTLNVEVERYPPGLRGIVEAMGDMNAYKAIYVLVYAFLGIPFLSVISVACDREIYVIVASWYQGGSLCFAYYCWQAIRYFHRAGAEK